jgi:hypothetical protein
MVQLIVLATWKNIPLSNFTNSEVLGEITHTRVVSTNFDSRYGGQNFGIFGYEEDFSRTKVFDDIVGDLKIDTLYIFDKTVTF